VQPKANLKRTVFLGVIKAGRRSLPGHLSILVVWIKQNGARKLRNNLVEVGLDFKGENMKRGDEPER
jgi:hypothetical protein